jgi:hypothetical protein
LLYLLNIARFIRENSAACYQELIFGDFKPIDEFNNRPSKHIRWVCFTLRQASASRWVQADLNK